MELLLFFSETIMTKPQSNKTCKGKCNLKKCLSRDVCICGVTSGYQSIATVLEKLQKKSRSTWRLFTS